MPRTRAVTLSSFSLSYVNLAKVKAFHEGPKGPLTAWVSHGTILRQQALRAFMESFYVR